MIELNANHSRPFPALFDQLLDAIKDAGEWVPGLRARWGEDNPSTVEILRPDGVIVGSITNLYVGKKED